MIKVRKVEKEKAFLTHARELTNKEEEKGEGENLVFHITLSKGKLFLILSNQPPNVNSLKPS